MSVSPGSAYRQPRCAAAVLWCSFQSPDFGLRVTNPGDCSCSGLRRYCLYRLPCLSARGYGCVGRGAEAGPACWISLAKASFPTRTQAVPELGELAHLPEGSPRPGSKHRDVQITLVHPARLHGSALLHKGRGSGSWEAWASACARRAS